MMRKLQLWMAILAIVLSTTAACTQQQRAKNFGGTATVDLPKGQKLVVATWKRNSLWTLTRDIRSDEKPESYTFQESSSFGIMEGKVIFRESR